MRRSCEACNIAGSEGSCAAIPADTDPADECALSCDGMRACQSEMPADAGVDGGGDAGGDAGSDAGDAGPGVDSGAGSDAGADAAIDAMGADAALDSGSTGPGGVSGGGCGVHAAGSGQSLWLLLVFGLMFRRRRG